MDVTREPISVTKLVVARSVEVTEVTIGMIVELADDNGDVLIDVIVVGTGDSSVAEVPSMADAVITKMSVVTMKMSDVTITRGAVGKSVNSAEGTVVVLALTLLVVELVGMEMSVDNNCVVETATEGSEVITNVEG